MSTKIYGASDDLIEFEGDVSGEVGCYDTEVLLICSDGTLVKVIYGDEGIWKITALKMGSLFKHILICEDEDADPHSDILEFQDGLKWVYAAKEWEKVR